jgi:hypothetical protein
MFPLHRACNGSGLFVSTTAGRQTYFVSYCLLRTAFFVLFHPLGLSTGAHLRVGTIGCQRPSRSWDNGLEAHLAIECQFVDKHGMHGRGNWVTVLEFLFANAGTPSNTVVSKVRTAPPGKPVEIDVRIAMDSYPNANMMGAMLRKKFLSARPYPSPTHPPPPS